MLSLIVPVCGSSTRYPNMRPKWLLTHPLGDLMAVYAILGLELDKFDKIYFVALKEHEEQYHFLKGLKENLKIHGLDKKSKVVFLDKPTSSQPETVYAAIKKEKIKGGIFIKDCDNFFNLKGINGDCIAYACLSDFETINPNNKSYIKINQGDGQIVDIIEKEIVSTTFCCGGYGFKSAIDFIERYENLIYPSGVKYVSDIIYSMLWDDGTFTPIKCSNYSDWGTLEDWNKYKEQYKTIFIDLDGTLVGQSSGNLPPYIGTTKALEKNVKILQDLANKNYVFVVITTSRPNTPKYRKITENQLKKLKIPYNTLFMGLPHAKRFLINDYSLTNPYPSAVAINLSRNGDDLEKYL